MPLPSGKAIPRHLLLLGYLLFTTYPLVWMTLAAFRHEGDAQAHPLAWPDPWTLDNLRQVLSSGSFGTAYVNSLLISVSAVALTLAAAALAAFALACLDLPGRKLLFLLFLLGLMIPVHVTLIPLNFLMGREGLNLKGGLWALLGPYVGFSLPVSILILRNAFQALPRELLEAGHLDGCSPWQALRHIALPLSRPALATVVIFNFLTLWNEYAFALTLLGPGTTTLPLAVTEFKGEHDMLITRVCAALVLIVVPLLLVYFFAQKQIIRGLTAGAVKE